MPRRKKTAETPPEMHPCAIGGCTEPGEFKAPRSRNDLRDYQWLCLEHVRQFNTAWNYFKGMETEEIEAFMHDALTGHRPTWRREDNIRRPNGRHREALDESLTRFFNWDEESIRRAASNRIPSRERRALDVLELDDRLDAPRLKKHFRTLVKRYHPDLHQGDRDIEEKFKKINIAYRYLLTLYQTQ